MPKIPTYGVPQVQARVTPNVRIDDSGANEMRRAGAAIAGGMQDVAGVAMKIGEQAQAEVNATRLMQTQRRLQEMNTGLLNDPEKGAFSRLGESAINVDKEVMPEWDRRASEIVSGLPPALRGRAEEWVAQYRTSADTQLKRHALQEGRKFRVSEAEATVVTHVKAGAINFQDPDAVDMAGQQAGASAAELSRLMGEGPAAARLRADEARSATYAGAIDRMMTADPVNGPMRAQQRLDAWKPLMTPEHASAIEAKIAPIMAELEIESIVDAEEAGIPTTTVLPPQRGRPTQQVVNAIEAAAVKHGVPQEFLYALAEQESSFNPKAYNAEFGASGIVQYIPSTAQEQGIDPYDVNQAIDAAARQFAERMKKGGASFAIAAHFAGDGGAEAVVNRGRTAENPKTAQYITEVTGRAMRWRQQLGGRASEDGTDPRMENPLFRRRVEARKREREQVRRHDEQVQDAATLESLVAKVASAPAGTPLARSVGGAYDLAVRKGWVGKLESVRQDVIAPHVRQTNPIAMQDYIDTLSRNPNAFASPETRLKILGDENLSATDTQRLLSTHADLNDPKKREQTIADWATQDDRLRTAAMLAGIDGKPEKKQAELKDGLRRSWDQAEREFIQRTGKKPAGAEADALMRSVAATFAKRLADGNDTSFTAYERFAAGSPVQGRSGSVALSPQDRALVAAELRRRGNTNPTEAQIIAAAATYYSQE